MRNLYWVTDGTYQSAFLVTRNGVALFDAPPTIGHNLRRAVEGIAETEGVGNTVTHLASLVGDLAVHISGALVPAYGARPDHPRPRSTFTTDPGPD